VLGDRELGILVTAKELYDRYEPAEAPPQHDQAGLMAQLLRRYKKKLFTMRRRHAAPLRRDHHIRESLQLPREGPYWIFSLLGLGYI